MILQNLVLKIFYKDLETFDVSFTESYDNFVLWKKYGYLVVNCNLHRIVTVKCQLSARDITVTIISFTAKTRINMSA